MYIILVQSVVPTHVHVHVHVQGVHVHVRVYTVHVSVQEESELQRRLEELIMREKMVLERTAPINSGTALDCM